MTPSHSFPTRLARLGALLLLGARRPFNPPSASLKGRDDLLGLCHKHGAVADQRIPLGDVGLGLHRVDQRVQLRLADAVDAGERRDRGDERAGP